MQGFVVAEESPDEHSLQTVVLIGGNLEVTHQEVREVIASYLKQQLVLVYAVRFVGEDEDEFLVGVGTQGVSLRRVCCEGDVTPRPYIADVELTSVQSATLLHTLYNHTCHLCHLTLGMLFHHFFQLLQTAAGITVVQAAQTIDEDELGSVLTQWETVC